MVPEGLKGKGVRQDYEEALRWFEKAAAQGEVQSMKNLGWLYEEGKGVAQDFKKALRWYRKAASLGNADAESGLAGMYRDGKGTAKDLKKAAELYRKARSMAAETLGASLPVSPGSSELRAFPLSRTHSGTYATALNNP